MNNRKLEVSILLKERMQERKLTQRQLADKAGVRQATISAILNNNEIEKLHIPTVEKLINALDISEVSDLINIDIKED